MKTTIPRVAIISLFSIILYVTNIQGSGLDFKVACFLEPTYTPASITNANNLLGNWTPTGTNDVSRCVFTASDDGNYNLELHYGERVEKYTCVLFHIGQDVFLDLTCETMGENDPVAFLTHIPGHILFKVDMDDASLTLICVDYSKLAEGIGGKTNLFHYSGSGFRKVITDSSEHIQEVFGHNEVQGLLFTSKMEMRFRRKVN